MISAIVGFQGLKMPNFCKRYLQVIERAGRGCIISMRSILKLSKMCDADVKFAKEASSSPRKGKMQIHQLSIMDPIVWTHQTDN